MTESPTDTVVMSYVGHRIMMPRLELLVVVAAVLRVTGVEGRPETKMTSIELALRPEISDWLLSRSRNVKVPRLLV